VRKLLVAAITLVVLVTGGTWAYINVVRDDPPDRLGVGTTPAAPAVGSIEGTWRPTTASQFGYRVNELLAGQSATAVGRTNTVTGSMAITGTTVTAVDLTVDMASITSDESRRDNQFRGRIMDVQRFPTAMFKLTSPIELGAVGDAVTTRATGALTLRGTTKPVTVDLTGRRNGARIEVSGTFPIVFAEWGIPNPSFGPARTEDRGVMELLAVFERG
jgi:polyisoprenoid-binding protein YceI